MIMPDVPESQELRRAREAAVVIPLGSAKEWKPPETDWEALEEAGEPEPRDWIIDQWLGMGFNTLIAGRGGMGKSMLALHFAAHIALGREFIAKVPKPRIVLSWMGEDDEKELHRRILPIMRKLNVPLSVLRGRYIQSPMVGEECCLMDLAAGQLMRTSALTALREQIGDHQAEFVMLDNTSLLFGGNENDRSQVARFHTALRWAAQPTNAGILLIGHPAKNKGSEYSGSTAWENQARGRLYFSDKPSETKDEEDDDADPVSDFRYLRKRKVNYSSKDICKLRYVGALPGKYGTYDIEMPPAGAGSLITSIDTANARKVVLAAFSKLTAMNLQPNEVGTSPSYLPRLILGHGFAEGFPRVDLARAMRTLMNDGVLRREPIGKFANRTTRYGLVLHNEAAQ